MARYEDGDVEQRLRADALEVRVDASPELRARIDASIRSAAQIRSVPDARDSVKGNRSSWWASGLTGLAAALLIILLIDNNREGNDSVVPHTEERIATTVTPEVSERLGTLPLKVRTADLTGPLEEELVHLQADLEKARQSVERDLRSTL
jgi:hypothetical protein